MELIFNPLLMAQPHECTKIGNMEKFSWSESGKELLSYLTIWINSEGGFDKLARVIEKEWPLVNMRQPLKSICVGTWRDFEVDYLRSNFRRYGAKHVAQYLGKTVKSVRNKANRIVF